MTAGGFREQTHGVVLLEELGGEVETPFSTQPESLGVVWGNITGLTDASALLAQGFSSSESASIVTGTGICSDRDESTHIRE